MEEVANAVYDLLDYLRQKELRDKLETILPIELERRYATALETGNDPDLINALQGSPYRYSYVDESDRLKAQKQMRDRRESTQSTSGG